MTNMMLTAIQAIFALLLCAGIAHAFDDSTIHRHVLGTVQKKFDIIAHPKSQDYMTVVMKGLDGISGNNGPQGTQGPEGDPGPQGPPGDKGIPGVCTRDQCENKELRALIQRLLALEKYVHSKNSSNANNTSNNNTTNGKSGGTSMSNNTACNNGSYVFIPFLPPCNPAITIFPIIPLPASVKVPAEPDKPDKPATTKNPATGSPSPGVTQYRTGPTQPQSKPTAHYKPPSTATPPPASTPQQVATSNPPQMVTTNAIPAVTIQGIVTTQPNSRYDNPFLTDIPAQAQPQTVILSPFVSYPMGSKVAPGSGPINIQQLRADNIHRTPQGWTLSKKDSIPSTITHQENKNRNKKHHTKSQHKKRKHISSKKQNNKKSKKN